MQAELDCRDQAGTIAVKDAGMEKMTWWKRAFQHVLLQDQCLVIVKRALIYLHKEARQIARAFSFVNYDSWRWATPSSLSVFCGVYFS